MSQSDSMDFTYDMSINFAIALSIYMGQKAFTTKDKEEDTPNKDFPDLERTPSLILTNSSLENSGSVRRRLSIKDCLDEPEIFDNRQVSGSSQNSNSSGKIPFSRQTSAESNRSNVTFYQSKIVKISSTKSNKVVPMSTVNSQAKTSISTVPGTSPRQISGNSATTSSTQNTSQSILD